MSSVTELSEQQLDQLSLAVAKHLNVKTPPEAYTIDGAAKATGVSRRVIESAVYDGTLRAKKIGRRWMIRRDSLLRWLA